MITITYVTVAVITTDLVIKNLLGKADQQRIESIRNELSLVKYKLEVNVFRNTYPVDSLAHFVSLDPILAEKNWQSLAKKTLSNSDLIMNIGLAPNDILSYIYPLKENRNALGLNLRSNLSEQRATLIARDSKKAFISDPKELIQGGKALIIRYPIFTDLQKMNDYWGSLNVAIDYERLIEKSNLYKVSEADVALVVNSNSGEKDKLIEGNKNVIGKFDISYSIYLPTGKWTLFAKYKKINKNEALKSFKNLLIILAAIIFTIGYLLLLSIINNYSRMKKLALHDELTHLPNRRYLLNEMNRIMSRKNGKTNLTLLNIDLNRFKNINDSLGHDAGDEALKYTALKLADCLRSSDFISRVGGDEFIAIITRSTTQKDIDKIIRKIHNSLESKPMIWFGKEVFM